MIERLKRFMRYKKLIIIVVHCVKINKLNVKLKRETNKFLAEKEINEKIKDNSKYSTV